MQSRIFMYIVVVCLNLLWLETANCVLVFQDWSNLFSLALDNVYELLKMRSDFHYTNKRFSQVYLLLNEA